MIKVIATCGFGFGEAEREEEFEFTDDYTEREIEKDIWEWAEQFLNVSWERVDEEE